MEKDSQTLGGGGGTHHGQGFVTESDFSEMDFGDGSVSHTSSTSTI